MTIIKDPTLQKTLYYEDRAIIREDWLSEWVIEYILDILMILFIMLTMLPIMKNPMSFFEDRADNNLLTEFKKFWSWF